MSRIIVSLFAALVALVAFSQSASADSLDRPTADEINRVVEAAPETVTVTGPKWSVGVTYVSEYVALGYKSGAAVQTDLFAKWASGWSVDLWWSTGVNDFPRLNSDFGDEVDLEIGKEWELDNGLTISANLAWFALYDLTESSGDMIRPKVEASYSWELSETVSLSMSAKIENLLLLPDLTSRWITGGEVSVSWQATEKFSVDFSLKSQYDFGDDNADHGWLLTPKVSLTYAVNDCLSIKGAFEYWKLSGFNDGREDSKVLSLGISLNL